MSNLRKWKATATAALLAGAIVGYGAMAEKMAALAAQQPGYLGMESARGADGLGITISYWRDETSIAAWKRDTAHQQAQRGGKETWYADYQVRVAKVERAYGGTR